jgi:hypothetical protein
MARMFGGRPLYLEAKAMGHDNYLRISRDQVKLWMQQIIAGVDNQQTHYFLE